MDIPIPEAVDDFAWDPETVIRSCVLCEEPVPVLLVANGVTGVHEVQLPVLCPEHKRRYRTWLSPSTQEKL